LSRSGFAVELSIANAVELLMLNRNTNSRMNIFLMAPIQLLTASNWIISQLRFSDASRF
jgi:hypothetical protein